MVQRVLWQVFIQVMMFRELVNVRYSNREFKDLPLYRTTQWLWFGTSLFYTYGASFFSEKYFPLIKSANVLRVREASAGVAPLTPNGFASHHPPAVPAPRTPHPAAPALHTGAAPHRPPAAAALLRAHLARPLLRHARHHRPHAQEGLLQVPDGPARMDHHHDRDHRSAGDARHALNCHAATPKHGADESRPLIPHRC